MPLLRDSAALLSDARSSYGSLLAAPSAVMGSRACMAMVTFHNPAILDPEAPASPTPSVVPVRVCSYLHTNLEMVVLCGDPVVPLHIQFLLLLAELTPETSANL